MPKWLLYLAALSGWAFWYKATQDRDRARLAAETIRALAEDAGIDLEAEASAAALFEPRAPLSLVSNGSTPEAAAPAGHSGSLVTTDKDPTWQPTGPAGSLLGIV